MTDIPQDMTPAAATAFVEAVVGPDNNPFKYATQSVRSGDIAIVLRAEGGVEILSLLPDNPNQEDLASLGVRGTVALALSRLLHLEQTVVADAVMEVAGNSETLKVAFQ